MSALLPIIVQVLVATAAIALPTLAALAYKKLKGNAKYDYAVKLIAAAMNALKAYIVTHPEIKADGQEIYNFIKSRVLAVLPLTDAEFDYLFLAVESAIAALIGADVSAFSKVSIKLAGEYRSKNGRLYFHKNRLFA